MSSVVRSQIKTVTLAACALGIAALLAGPADAAAKRPAYLGEWGLDVQSCRSGNNELGITRTTYGEVDTVCRIRSVSGGNGVWRLSLNKCQGDGAPKTAKLTIWATATRATVLHAGTKFRNNFVRCR